MTPFQSPSVAHRFAAYPPLPRQRLLALRALVFSTAAATPGVGDIDESLKWGEPAYRPRNGGGSTLRMDHKPKAPNQVAMYFHCQTTLVATFRTLFPRDFSFQGNRALLLNLASPLPTDALSVCISAALTYHHPVKAARVQRREA